MQRLVFALIGLVLLGVVVVTAMDWGKAPPPEHGGQTAQRLGARQMERMVAGPMKLVAKKDMAGASALFEADLARAGAKGGLRSGDLLTAYGVQLRTVDRDKESIPYFARAVEAYRAAEPAGPNLALALADYAKVLILDSPKTPPPAALAALRESLKIREASLGRANAETANTYVQLGEIQGFPVFTGRDPGRVAAAAALIRTGIQLLPATPNAASYDLANAKVALVELYARNGDAAATLKAAADLAASEPDFSGEQLRESAEAFEAAGDVATGRRLRDQFGIVELEKGDAQPAATPPTIKNAGKPRVP